MTGSATNRWQGPGYIQRVFCPLERGRCSTSCDRVERRDDGRLFCLEIGDRIAVVCGEGYRHTDTPFMDKRTFEMFRRRVTAFRRDWQQGRVA